MSKITLYTVHPSRGNNVRWMLAECGADYDTVALDFPQLKEAGYLAINPMGKVPAIAHAGNTTAGYGLARSSNTPSSTVGNKCHRAKSAAARSATAISILH